MGNFWIDWRELSVLQDYVGDSFLRGKTLMRWKGEMLKLEKSTNDDNLLKVMCIIYVRKSIKYN